GPGNCQLNGRWYPDQHVYQLDEIVCTCQNRLFECNVGPGNCYLNGLCYPDQHVYRVGEIVCTCQNRRFECRVNRIASDDSSVWSGTNDEGPGFKSGTIDEGPGFKFDDSNADEPEPHASVDIAFP
ncbi:unnamed protein product, partial [Candidula unifasciata]